MAQLWAPDQQRITPQKSGALRSIRGTRHICFTSSRDEGGPVQALTASASPIIIRP
jgi:hypothetical protein